MNKRLGFWIRVFTLLRKGRIVCLTDHWGGNYFTIATVSASGDLVCNVYWCLRTGMCILLKDGVIHPTKSTSSYISKWEYVKIKSFKDIVEIVLRKIYFLFH